MSKGNKVVIFLLIFIIISAITLLVLNDRGVIELCKSCKCEVECPKCDSQRNEIVDPDAIINGDITDEDKKETLAIVGLTEEGVSKLSKETLESLDITEGSYADIGWLTLAGKFFLEPGEYLTTDLSIDDKMLILVCASSSYHIGFDVQVDDAHVGLSDSDYKKLAKKYNFSENAFTIFDKNTQYKNGYYLFGVTGATLNLVKVEDKISFNKTNSGLIINYSAKIGDTSSGNYSNRTYKYTFRKNSDDSYYLYKINVTNN